MQGVFLALGGNLGDREAQLTKAKNLLAKKAVLTVRASALYENPALLPENAPAEWNVPFLNQVIEVQTTLAPEMLLETLKDVEAALGREASARWAPRPIDIDILAYHDQELSSQRLTIPHPEWYKRDFVVLPWFEIAPDWHWHGMNLRQLHPTLQDGDVRRYAA